MSPQELFDQAAEVLAHCDATGVKTEDAEPFISSLQDSIRRINGWLPPVLGMVGYADGQLIDQLRQLKFHSESAMRNFPGGVSPLCTALVAFRQYLQTIYPIQTEDLRDIRRD